MTPAPPPTSRSLTAFAYLVRGAVKPPSLLELRQGLSAVRGRPARSRQPLCWAIVAVPSLLLLTLIPVYFHTRASPPETSVVVTQIEGGELLDGGYVSETGHSGIKLRFNEGSRFDLEPGSRGRLRVIPPEGTRLSLERGTVEWFADFAHRNFSPSARSTAASSAVRARWMRLFTVPSARPVMLPISS